MFGSILDWRRARRAVVPAQKYNPWVKWFTIEERS
jgi:hypothetical protein